MTFGGFVRGIAQTIGNITGNRQRQEQNAIAREMLEIERSNLGLQGAQLNYQQDLQQDIFNREDTAVQRRAEDLEAAGLHPSMAAGQSARAGAVVPTTAPQRGTKAQQMRFDLQQNLLAMKDFPVVLAQVGQMMAEKRKTDAEASYLEQTLGARVKMTEQEFTKIVYDNKFLKDTLHDRIQTLVNDRHTSEGRATVMNAEAEMAQADRDNYQTAQNWVRANFEDLSGMELAYAERHNPYIVKIIAQDLTNQIMSHNLGIAGDLPVGQQTTTDKLLADFLRSVMPDLKRVSRDAVDALQNRRKEPKKPDTYPAHEVDIVE